MKSTFMFSKHSMMEWLNDYRAYINRSSLITLETENCQRLSILSQLNEAVI